MPSAAGPLTRGTLVFAALLWVQRTWNLAKRLRYSYVAVVNLLFVLVLNYWNLIGWNYF